MSSILLLCRLRGKRKRMHLSTKLIISYLFIVMLSIAALYQTISVINEKSIEQQAIDHNSAMLQSISESYVTKCIKLKNAIANLYTNSLTSNEKNDMWDILLGNMNGIENTVEYMFHRKSLINYMRENTLNTDQDLIAASIVLVEENKVFTVSNKNFNLDPLLLDRMKQEQRSFTGKNRINYIAPMDGGYDKLMFHYYQLVNKLDVQKIVGYMVFTYSPDVVKNMYQAYESTRIGDILLLSGTGDILFDSKERYSLAPVLELKSLSKQKKGIVKEKDRIINYVYNSTYDFYTVGMIYKEDLDIVKNPVHNIAFVGIILFFIAACFLSIVFSKSISSRLVILKDTMNRVRQGELSARVKLKGNDEIKEIADYFNSTCESIENYIKREYVYQMRQKEAEIYALQNQINPHFLYNALEAIRMKAVTNEDMEVGQMVLCLATIFRGSLKGDSVISLKQEIKNCESFLEFYNIRYDYSIDLINTIEEQFYSCKVIQHMIQPILENALVHGLNLKQEDNRITLNCIPIEEYLIIEIIDNGKGVEKERLRRINEALHQNMDDECIPKKGSIGIINVHERVQLIFGEDCGIRIESNEGVGTKVSIKIRKVDIEGELS